MKGLEVPIDIGAGDPVVVLHGYAMRPATYQRLAVLLAERCRVVIPDLFAVRGRWSCAKVLEELTTTLDRRGFERVTLVAHSFGGGIQLGFASRFPERVVELVFSDTLGMSREWGLADEALRHLVRLRHLVTPLAATSFVRSWLDHPRQLVDGAWWGFTSGRQAASQAIARAGVPAHVLWANRDSLLSRRDGEAFAQALNASFTVASAPHHGPIDHDWMFQQPEVFAHHLDELHLSALKRRPARRVRHASVS